MVVYAYLGPYKSKMANRIEAFLAVDSLLLLFSSMPDTTSEAVVPALVASLPAGSSSDPCRHSLYIAPWVIFIAICYYAPLLILLLVPVVMGTGHFWYVHKLKIR